jgi:hypothetical protein
MSDADCYEKYAAWCHSLGIRPAAPEIWAQETRKIADAMATLNKYGVTPIQVLRDAR